MSVPVFSVYTRRSRLQAGKRPQLAVSQSRRKPEGENAWKFPAACYPYFEAHKIWA